MDKKKIIKAILLSIVLIVLFSLLLMLITKKNYYLDKDIRKHGEAKIYTADLNHDGIIDDTERNLTWKESFNVLMEQVQDKKKLIEFSKNMQIAEDEDEEIKCQLVRYEILHQCEELITISGCVIPVLLGNQTFKIKDHVKDIYICNLSYLHFDQMYSKEKKYIDVELGANVRTLDIESAVDGNSLFKISPLGIGLKRYSSKSEYFVQEDKHDLKTSINLEDGMALLLKLKSSTSTNDVYCFFLGKYKCNQEQKNIPSYFKSIEILEKNKEKDQNGEILEKVKKIKAIAENKNEFIFEKENDARWEDGKFITPDDFIWSWNRMVNKKFKANYANLFYSIDGFKEYSEKTGQENYDEIEKIGTYALYNGIKGLKKFKKNQKNDSIIGLKKEDYNDDYFEVSFESYCSYFDSLLTSPFFYPMPRHIMTENTGKKGEKIIEGWWSKNKNFSSGPFKIKSLNNVFNGTMEMVKNENYLFKDEVKNDGFNFFLSASTKIYSKYQSGSLDVIKSFDTVDIGIDMDTGKENYPDDLYFCSKHKRTVALNFYFGKYGSLRKHVDVVCSNASKDDKEMVYQQIYRFFSLIINRYDLSINVDRKKSEISVGYVGKCSEILPIRKDNYVRAARNLDGTVKIVDWNLRNGLKIVNEEVINRGNYSFRKIITEYNRFEKRDDSSSDDSYTPIYRGSPKNPEYRDEIKKYQKRNIQKAIQLAKEVGFKYDDKKGEFTNFPGMKMIVATSHGAGDMQDRLDYLFRLFNIKVDFQTLDWNAFLSYQEAGFYEFAFYNWLADYDDPHSYIFFFQAGDSSNNFVIGE